MVKYHFECKTEECLLYNFDIQNHEIEHHNGRGQVCKILEDNKGLVGLIDEDPEANHHPYFKKLNGNAISDQYGIRFCRDSKNKNRLIIIRPKFEDWIIQTAIASKISMSDFGLSNDPNILHRDVIFKIGELQKLIHKLKRIKSPAIIHLQKLLI